VRYTKRWHKTIDKWLGHTYFHIVCSSVKVIISIFTNIKVIIGNSTKVSSSIFIRRSRSTYIKFRVDVFLNTLYLIFWKYLLMLLKILVLVMNIFTLASMTYFHLMVGQLVECGTYRVLPPMLEIFIRRSRSTYIKFRVDVFLNTLYLIFWK
jgi:hypothetical protein